MKRIHKKVRKGRKWVWCDRKMRAKWSGKACPCGVRWECR